MSPCCAGSTSAAGTGRDGGVARGRRGARPHQGGDLHPERQRRLHQRGDRYGDPRGGAGTGESPTDWASNQGRCPDPRQLAQVVADNPFPKEAPRQLHEVFWNGPLGPEELAAVAAAQRQAGEAGGRDEARVVGTTMYLHTPDGYGRSELAARLARIGGGRTASTAATARNWATVRKLLAMCDS